MGVRICTKHFITLPNGEETLLPFHPDYLAEEITYAALPDGGFVVAYLVPDHDCQNPFETSDVMGAIWHHPRSRYGRCDGYYDALGLDSHGSPHLDLAEEQYAALLKARGLSVEEFDGDETDALWREAWEQGIRDGAIGNRYTVLLDVYGHGCRSYSLSRTGTRCRFDTSIGEALWVADAECQAEIDRRVAGGTPFNTALRTIAAACVTEYDAWQRGECYGVVTFSCDAAGQHTGDYDACWGYIGIDSARQGRDSHLSIPDIQGTQSALPPHA